MSGWTIYDHPSDMPDVFVARKWVTRGERVIATTEVYTGPTLDAVRAQLPPGLYCLPRFEGDEPHIVEVWL